MQAGQTRGGYRATTMEALRIFFWNNEKGGYMTSTGAFRSLAVPTLAVLMMLGAAVAQPATEAV